MCFASHLIYHSNMSSMPLEALSRASALLAAEDIGGIPVLQLAEDLTHLHRLISGLEAQWLRRLEVFDRRGGATAAGAVGTSAWVRSECRIAPAVARDQVELARRLPDLPDTAAALEAGDISVGHAQLISAALRELAEAAGAVLAGETEPAVVDVARMIDPARLRRELVHVRQALAPEADAAAAERAFARRSLSVSETFGGVVALNGMLDSEGGAVLLAAITALSGRAGPDDRRTARQRRADALVELARQQLDAGRLPAVGGERPHLTVVVNLETLERHAAESSDDAGTTHDAAPAHDADQVSYADRVSDAPWVRDADRVSDGYPGVTSHGTQRQGVRSAAPGDRDGQAGTSATAVASGSDARADVVPRTPRGRAPDTGWAGPISGEAARRLACDAGISRVIVDGPSQPLDVGRRTRTIPPALRTALVVRDRGCVFPGCDRPPPWTDAHHVTSWIDGGSTSLDNLALLCRIHHRTVHEGRWQLHRDPGGRWTARPLGHAAPSTPPHAA
jgi:hypothetical protein